MVEKKGIIGTTVSVEPQPIAPQVAPPRQFERQGEFSTQYSRMYPEIRGGVCAFCGVINDRFKGFQYTICPHFKDMGQVQCSYCPAEKDPNEVIRSHTIMVHDHPTDKDRFGNPTLVAHCDDYECNKKHLERFMRNS